ncbi:flagellar hook protein FlgE [Thiomicrorhabdus aquaedulcis]|uniref:flagellar hook protein FlgE n=1 Tax=Thiomicrorhabdus aquaedulcis TaxID=2211106 RepID=UPI001E369999|nr:flagellar hook protein FlgE [Thiomicrorhabdus aquaedulcis]
MASFDLNALSGINAASNGLAVISNNLANSQSVGFKASRAEFADMFSGPQNSPGSGVRVAAITQNFTQGTVSGTGRELDMAMNGEGFFVLEDQTGKYENVYTRNGSFKLDKEGFLTDQSGNKVQGYLLNEAMSTELKPVFSTALSSIDLDALNKIPKATSEMTYNINLNGQEVDNLDSTGALVSADLTKLTTPGDDNLNAYDGFPDYFYPMTIHDSLGGEHTLNANFYKNTVVDNGTDPKYTSWIAQYTITALDDQGNTTYTGHTVAPATPAAAQGQIYELRFDTNGQYLGAFDEASIGTLGATPITPVLNFEIDNPLTGATDPLGDLAGISLDFTDMSQFSGTYNQRGTTQNGYSIGDLVGLSTGLDGVIEARYSNGRSIPVAQLAVANFADKNAMEKLGGQTYAQSFASGAVQLGTPENNGFGSIVAGSLEYSNVDTAAELVNMIQTQRTYQASAQVISTSQELTRTILNL